MTEFSENIKISPKMADIILNAPYYLYTWLEGSAQCGKSVTAALTFCYLIESSPKEDRLFITLGYTESSAINNCWKCSGFGIEDYFGSRCTRGKYPGTNISALRIKTKTGMKYVLAFGTNTKTSNNAWHGFRVAGFLFDEIDRACEESIIEMQQRITAVKNPHIIVTQNPNHEKHPIYTFLDSLIERDLVNYTHWTIDDNVALSKDKIQEIKDRYDSTSIYYKRYILGLRVNPDAQIYNIRDYNIIDDFNPQNYINYVVVADTGENCSATGFVLAGLIYNEHSGQYEIHILKEYRHKNSEQNLAGIKLPKDYANDYCQFIQESQEMMGKYPQIVYIDEDITFYRELIIALREHNMPTINVRYVIKNEIDERIKQSINILYTGKLRFYSGCKYTIDTFKNAIYDSKKAEKGKFVYLDEPSNGTEIDLVDATCYAMNHYINKVYKN